MTPPDRLPAITTAGQSLPEPTDAVKERARLMEAAVNEVLAERATFHRDDTPLPTVGPAAPVAQPGRPPMSQTATDASALMLSGGVATVLVGGGVSLVMLASGHADPTVCGIVFGAPAVFALALSRVLRRAKDVAEAAPDTHHHHYNGDVVQDSRRITTQTRGVIANTRNQTR